MGNTIFFKNVIFFLNICLQLEQMVLELSRHEANIVTENEGLAKVRYFLSVVKQQLYSTKSVCNMPISFIVYPDGTAKRVGFGNVDV